MPPDADPDNDKPAPKPPTESLAQWLGLNRPALAVLVVIGCMGLSEEVWSSYLSLHLADASGSILKAVYYIGWIDRKSVV